MALSAKRGRGYASEESALDILKKRYATGEINKDEFEKIKRIFCKREPDKEKSVKIDCYISHGCGSEEALKENIAHALETGKIHAEVSIHRISDEKAAELKLSGSPSVFIDGKELQPQGIAGFS